MAQLAVPEVFDLAIRNVRKELRHRYVFTGEISCSQMLGGNQAVSPRRRSVDGEVATLSQLASMPLSFSIWHRASLHTVDGEVQTEVRKGLPRCQQHSLRNQHLQGRVNSAKSQVQFPNNRFVLLLFKT